MKLWSNGDRAKVEFGPSREDDTIVVIEVHRSGRDSTLPAKMGMLYGINFASPEEGVDDDMHIAM